MDKLYLKPFKIVTDVSPTNGGFDVADLKLMPFLPGEVGFIILNFNTPFLF